MTQKGFLFRRKIVPEQSEGFTLVELLISLSIAVIIGGLLMAIIVNSAGLFYKESSKLNAGLNINDTLAQLRKNIREASGIVSSYTSGLEYYSSGVGQIILKVSSIDQSNNIIPNTFDYFVFYIDQNNLHFKIFPDSQSLRKSRDQIFSTSVDSLVFNYFNGDNPPVEVSPVAASKVRVTLTLKERNGTIIEVNIATMEASLRNK